MVDADRFRLLGKYRTPRVRVGRVVRCEIRGEVEVVGFTAGPIPWPLGRTTRRPARGPGRPPPVVRGNRRKTPCSGRCRTTRSRSGRGGHWTL